MSLLTPKDPTLVTLNQQVQRIRNSPHKILCGMVDQWTAAWHVLWDSGEVTPAQRIAELGTDAGELFALSTQLVGFILIQLNALNPQTGQLKPQDEWRDPQIVGNILALKAATPNFMVNPDGTVTLT